MYKSILICLFLHISYSIIYGQVDENIYLPHFEAYIQKSELHEHYSEYKLSHAHQSRVSRIFHVYLNQYKDGIQVVDGVFDLHVLPNGKLLTLHDHFFTGSWPNPVAFQKLTRASFWVEKSWQSCGFSGIKGAVKFMENNVTSRKTVFELEDSTLLKAEAELVYLITDNKDVVLTWAFAFESIDGNDNWMVYANAQNGEILKKYNRVLHCQFKPEKDLIQKIPWRPQATAMDPLYEYRVFPLKVESPNHGGRSLEINPADTTASPYNWHDTNGAPGEEYTTTKGNNVEAREDIDGNNGTLGDMAEGGTNLIFDFPWNPLLHPHQNQDACITNLFYWNNVIHDIAYLYGFDEPSGNFQTNNYGNGGLGNDHVNADAMDGEGFNNANFFTPADGQSPRMQMFLWSGAVSLDVNSPPQVVGNYPFAQAEFGARTFNITQNVVLANDGSSQPSLACNDLINIAQINGKIAMVDNGTCEFSLKCFNAQKAGAIAVIVCNNVPGNPYIMPNGTYGSAVLIPSIMMRKEDCDQIKIYLNGGVNMTMIVGEPTDGDYDNGIICHEYGHGISTRLTGGAALSNCLFNQEQMGEGWSDWYGLMLTMEEDDDESRARGIGTYALNQPVGGVGIRTYRYSTNLSINPHTYNSIITEIIPHGVGSVWCAMLWEMTWALIREYGYDPDYYRGDGGNNKALFLVTEAMKLQPCSPGFIDARDAILLADTVLYGGQNACLIWKSFAKRGLGHGSYQGSSNDRSDGSQSFEMPPSCCTCVSNTNDSGNGSLRESLDCALNGDTIHFLNFIKNDSIHITTSTLMVNRNITIMQPESWNLVIHAQGAFPVFSTTSTVQMKNLHLVAGSGTGVRGIQNTGTLTLENIDILDPLAPSGNGHTIYNEGNLDVIENVQVRRF